MTAVRRVKINGQRGRWVAEVEGRWLAVLHHTQRVGPTGYRAPLTSVNLGGKRFEELVRALNENDLIVMQRDKDPTTLARDGYVGVFHFSDLHIDTTDEMVLTLNLTERYADPK